MRDETSREFDWRGRPLTTTYDEIQQAWKRELQNQELQPLRQGFFKDSASYVKRLKEAQRNLDPKSLKAVVMDEETKRLEQLLTQLVIMNKWATGIPGSLSLVQ